MSNKSLSGKFALVTGGTDGIGKEVARGLIDKGARVWIVGRDPKKGAATVKDLSGHGGDVTFIATDMGRMGQVSKLADRVLEENERIDILVHSAGVLSFEKKLNEDGIESNFAINYLGRFLLSEKLFPLLAKSKSRVINIAGAGMSKPIMDLKSLPGLPSMSGMKTFMRAQAANDIWGLDFASRLGGVMTTIMPGQVNTGLRKRSGSIFLRVIDFLIRPFSITAAEGAITPLWLATSAEGVSLNGKFFGPNKKPIKINPAVFDLDLRKYFYDNSIRLVGNFLKNDTKNKF